MTEITQYQPTQDALTLPQQMEYAMAVAKAGILPKAYQGQPGSVLVAMGLGSAMGLSPAESLYRIHVIEGKPSASAELIATNVRRAGHKLRVRGDARSATVTIIRADDTEFPFEVTWTIEDAQRAGLASKGVWKSYPAAMLKARAITECARTACPEALYGIQYTEEEARESLADGGAEARPQRESAAALIGAAASTPAEPRCGCGNPSKPGMEHRIGAPCLIPEAPKAEPEAAEEQPAAPAIEPATSRQVTAINIALKARGVGTKGSVDETRAAKLAWLSEATGRPIASSKELTKDEATTLLDHFAVEDAEREQAAEPAAAEPFPND